MFAGSAIVSFCLSHGVLGTVACPAVLVLGLHYGALGVARSLGRRGVPVYTAGPTTATPVARSRYVRGHYRWAVDVDDPRRSVQALKRIGDYLGRRPLLLPASDAATLLVEEHSETLLESFEFRPRPQGLARALSSKREMYDLCLRHDVPTPTTLFPESADTARGYADQLSFPVVIKPVDSMIANGSSAPRMTIASTSSQMVDTVAKLGGNALIQEYVPGSSETVWMLNGYFDGAGRCLFGMTGRKLRQHPASGGVTSLGLCSPNGEVRELACRFMQAVGYHGILDCGFRFDARDGRYKLLDVNPRIGATFRLFVDSLGEDVVRAWYCDLTGRPFVAGQSLNGRRWLAEDIDLASSVRSMFGRTLHPVEWARSFAGVRETAWIARDDLKPALILPLNHLRMRLGPLRASPGRRGQRRDGSAERRDRRSPLS